MPDNMQDDEIQSGWKSKILRFFGRGARPERHDTVNTDKDEQQQQVNSLLSSFLTTKDWAEKVKLLKEMADVTIVGAIVNTYAEEATQTDPDTGRVATVKAPKNKNMEVAGHACLDNLLYEDRVFMHARNIALYGNEMRRNLYAAEKGVLGSKWVDIGSVRRVDDKYDRLAGFKQTGVVFGKKGERQISYPWDYAHGRVLENGEDEPMGTSMVYGLFRDAQALSYMQDAATLFRINRKPDRNIFKVGMGDLSEGEEASELNRIKKIANKQEYFSPGTGKYKAWYGGYGILSDIFLPTSEGRDITVDPWQGSGDIGSTSDIDLQRRMLFGKGRIPSAYFGFDGGEWASGKSLSQQDVRMARTIKRLRRALIQFTRSQLDLHYLLLGGAYDLDKKENSYVIEMPAISNLDEMDRLSLLQMRVEIVGAYAALGQSLRIDPMAWTHFVLTEYARLSDDQVSKIIAKASDIPQGQEQQAAESAMGAGTTVSDAKHGFYPMSKTERETAAKIMRESVTLRSWVQTTGTLLHENELIQRAASQTDWSAFQPLIPDVSSSGVTAMFKEQDFGSDTLNESEDVTTIRKAILTGLKPDGEG